MSGGDSISKKFEVFSMEHGMPQDIGPPECTNHTVVAMAKQLLKAQKLKKSLWMEAVANTVYTLTCCLTMVLFFVTPTKKYGVGGGLGGCTVYYV